MGEGVAEIAILIAFLRPDGDGNETSAAISCTSSDAIFFVMSSMVKCVSVFTDV